MTVLPLVLVTALATATPEECASAAEHAVPLKKAGRFAEALEPLLLCVADECPRVVRDLCRSLRAEVDFQVPTIVVTIQTDDHVDAAGATLRIDGEPVALTAGAVIPLDPGLHVLELAAPGFVGQRLELAIRAGEKLRPVVVSLRAQATLLPPPAPRSPFRLLPPLLTSVGAAAGLGVFGGLGLSVRSQFEGLQRGCGQSCDPRQVDGLRLRAGVADAALVAGVVFATVAVWLWVTFSSPSPGAE